MNSILSRRSLRQQMRQRRRALPKRLRKHHARSLLRHFSHNLSFLRSQHIAFYLANDGELDLSPLIQRAWRYGKTCYLPVLRPFRPGLWFAPYTPHSRLQNNRFKIAEPIPNYRRIRPLWALHLVLMPLVAFDFQGGRLGMGGGYYDRSFSYLQRQSARQQPLLLGAAYEFQGQEKLPQQAWDVKLQGIVTERRHLKFSKSQGN